MVSRLSMNNNPERRYEVNNKASWIKATIEVVMYGTEGLMIEVIEDMEEECRESFVIRTVSIEDMDE